MGWRNQKLFLFLIDAVAINLAWTLYFFLRVQSGWVLMAVEPDFWLPMIAVYIYWLILFWSVGLYRPWYAASRVDELMLVLKTISFGCLFLFFIVFVDDQGNSTGTNYRLLIVLYWTILVTLIGIGRLVLRSFQRRLLVAGVGTHNALIVGSEEKSRYLFDEVEKSPALGYRVVGFAGIGPRQHMTQYKKVRLLGSMETLADLIDTYKVEEVLIALDSDDHCYLARIIEKCNGHKVGLKIMPDLYDIISGQVRTNQIYGFPLIAITPQLMAPWEQTIKRSLDVAVATVVILFGLPVWLLIALLIRLESPGAVLYKQERVGRDGVIFRIIKFRSMRHDAEKSGPQWAGKKDPRVTRVGLVIRRLHLDEVPQVLNILAGHMSLVGPRPERPVFVEKLAQEIPLYKRRLAVRPGITGWAQVKQQYDETIEDVRKKVQYDLFYIENMSLRMDFKIILSTLSHMLLGKGR